ncbi:hypothetical protein ACROYT_G014377 [Oculina patagonica]
MSHMREQRRKAKDTEFQKGATFSDTSATSGDTESVYESSGSSSSSPPSSQFHKKKIYAEYFHPSMTHASCECIILAVLKKNTVKDVSLVKDLVPLKKNFMLSLLRSQDKNTLIRAIANSFYEQGYISIIAGVNLENLTREDITVVKSI